MQSGAASYHKAECSGRINTLATHIGRDKVSARGALPLNASSKEKSITIRSLTAGSMALLVDKHRPRSLEALSYHADLSERLKSLVGLQHPFNQLTLTGYFRRKAETSPTSLSMDLRAPGRRPG